MTESIYTEYENKYYNPTDNDKKPGDNDNWKSMQKGFYRIGHTQVETTEGLTLGKGKETETSISDTQLANMKAGKFESLTLGTGTAGETGLSAAQLANVKAGEFISLTLGKGTDNEESLTAEELSIIKNSGSIGKLVKTHFESNGVLPFPIPSGLNARSVQIDLSHVTGLKPNTNYFALWYASPISANYMTCNMDNYLPCYTDENGNLLTNAQTPTQPNMSVLFYNPGSEISNAPILKGLVIFEYTFAG